MANDSSAAFKARAVEGALARTEASNRFYGNSKQSRVSLATAQKERLLYPDRVASSEDNFLALNPLASDKDIIDYRVNKFRQDNADYQSKLADAEVERARILDYKADNGRRYSEVAGDVGSFLAKSAINTGAMVHGAADFALRHNPVAEASRVFEGLYNASQGDGFVAGDVAGLDGGENYSKANEIINQNFLSEPSKAQKERVAIEEQKRSEGQYDRVGEAIRNGDSELGAFLEEQVDTIGDSISSYIDNPNAAQDVAGESFFQLFGAGAAGAANKAKILANKQFAATEGGRQALKNAGEKGALGYVGGSEGFSNAVAVKAEVMGMKESDLTGSDEYKGLRDSGLSHVDARARMANEASDYTLATNATFAMAISLVTGTAKLEGNFIGAKVLKDTARKAKGSPVDMVSGNKILAAAKKVKDTSVAAANKTGAVQVTKAVGKEAIEEGSQGYSGEIVSGIALQESKPNENPLEKAASAAGAGIVAGSLSGAVVGAPTLVKDIPKAVGGALKGAASGVNELNKAVKQSKLQPEAKEAIKTGEIKGLIDKKPLAAAQAMLHTSTLEKNKDNLPEHLASAQEQVNQVTAVRDDLRQQAGVLIKEAASIEQQVAETGNTPELTKRAKEITAEVGALNKEIMERNKPIAALEEQFDKINTKESGKKAQEIDVIARKLTAKEETVSDLDDDTNTSDKEDNTVTGKDLRILMGSDASVFTQEDDVLQAVEKHPEATPEMKEQIKKVRELKDAKGVSAEILNGRGEDKNSDEYTGIIQHLERIVAAPNNGAIRNNYNRFRDHIKEKQVHAQTMLANAQGKEVDPNALIAAKGFFATSAAVTNKTLEDFDGGYYAKVNKEVSQDLKRFDKADAFIANLDAASPNASTEVVSSPEEATGGESQGTLETVDEVESTEATYAPKPLSDAANTKLKSNPKGRGALSRLNVIHDAATSAVEKITAAFSLNRRNASEVDKGNKPVVHNRHIDEVYDFYGEQGYEVIDRTGETFDQGMTVNEEYTEAAENAPEGAKLIISNVRTPEITKDGKIVQVASVTIDVAPEVESKQDVDQTLQQRMTANIAKVANKAAKKWLPKEQIKTGMANKFIGQGKPKSSTDNYRGIYAEEGLANLKDGYESTDVVFVASNGNRNGSVSPIVDGELQGEYTNLVPAMEAGATIVMDTQAHLKKTSQYNKGEIALARYMNTNGYQRDDTSGAGVWTKIAESIPQTHSYGDNVTTVPESSDSDGNIRFASTKDGKIDLVEVTKDTAQKFVNYISGITEKGLKPSATSKQKVKTLDYMTGVTLDKMVKFFDNDPAKMNKFLVAHEQSHIDNSDSDNYYSQEERDSGKKNYLSENKLLIEARATADGLRAIGYPDEIAVIPSIDRSDPVSTRNSTDDNPLVREARDAVRGALTKLNFKFVDKPDVSLTDIERVASKILTGNFNDDPAFIADAAKALSFALFYELGAVERSKATREWLEESFKEYLATGKKPKTKKGLWVRAAEAYNKTLSFFAGKEYTKISERLDTIIDGIKTGENDFSFTAKKGYKELDFQKEMDFNPGAVKVLIALQEAGIDYTLTGSVAYADQVPMHRLEGKPLHDIDLLMPVDVADKALELLNGSDQFGGAFELYNFVPGKKPQDKINNADKRVIGLAVVPVGYEIRDGKTSFTKEGKALRSYTVYKTGTNEEVGNYEFVQDSHETFTGIAGVTVDLMGQKSKERTVSQSFVNKETGKTETLEVASYIAGFTAKLGMLRNKDIIDYLGVVPPTVSDNTTQAKPEVVVEEIQEEEDQAPDGYEDYDQEGNNAPPPTEEGDTGQGQTVDITETEDIDLDVKANVALKGSIDKVTNKIKKIYDLTDTQVTRVKLYLGAKTQAEMDTRRDILEDVINGDLISDEGLKPTEKKAYKDAKALVEKLGLDTITESFLGALLQRDDLIHMPANKAANILNDIKNFVATTFKAKHTNSLTAKSSNLFSRAQLQSFKQAVADKMGVEDFDKDLTEAQKNGAVLAWKFVGKFIKDYKVVRTAAGVKVDPKKLHKQPVDYFSRLNKDGEYVLDDNVIASLGLAGFELIVNNLEDLAFRKDQDLRSLLQIREKDMTISNDLVKLFWNAGSVHTEKGRQVGMAFMNIMGVDIQGSTLTSERSKMIKDAGARVINSLVNMGVLEYMHVPTDLYNAAIKNPRDFNADNVDMAQFLMNDAQLAVYIKNPTFGKSTVRFVRGVTTTGEQGFPVLPEQSHTFANALNDTDSMGYKIFGITNVSTQPSFVKPEEAQTTTNTGRTDINPEAADIVHRESQAPLVVNSGMHTIATKLGLNAFLDMVRTAVDDPTRIYNETNEDSERSKVEQKERAITSFFDFLGRPEFLANPLVNFWIPKTFWSNSRVGEETSDITAQGDKLIRDLISYAEHNIKLKFTKGNESNLVGLKYAIVQAMGLGIDKMNYDQIISSFDSLVKEATGNVGETARGYKALATILDSDKIGKVAKRNLALIIDKDGDAPLLKLHGLMALKQYINARDNGGGDINTDIHYEVDGITNGFAITLMQMFTDGAFIPYAERGELLTQYIESGNTITDGKTEYDISTINTLFDETGNLTDAGHDIAKDNMESLQEMEFLNKLERVGVYTPNSEVQTAGDFATKDNKPDSYQNLARTLLNSLSKMHKFFNPESNSQLHVRLNLINALMSAPDLFGKGLSPIQRKEAFKKAINKGIFKDKKQSKTNAKLLKSMRAVLAANGISAEVLKGMSFVSPLSTKVMVNTFAAKTENQVFIERILAMSSFVGSMHENKPEAKPNGLIDYAINKLGRDIAKPSLLISNYGASITNIIRTFAEDVTNRMINSMVEIHKGLNSEKAHEREAAVNALAKLNKEINYIQGTNKNRIRFTPDNLLEAVDPKLIKSLQNHVTSTYGEALSHTLSERYGDMFKARSQLNAVTGLTYELFQAYYNKEKAKYLEVSGKTALTKDEEKAFDKTMEDLIPYYETYYSQEHKEGILGPNTSHATQQDNPAYAVRSPIVKSDGTKGEIGGYGSESQYDHPSVRIAVMLTHAMDAAVQIKLMKALREEFNEPFLNVHDAAGFAARNPEKYMELYNKAYMEVMTEYSLPTAIMAPLQRIFEATNKDYHDEILRIQLEVDKDAKNNNFKSSTNIGAFELNMAFQPLNIASMVDTAQAIVNRMNTAKLAFFEKYPNLAVSQYSVSNTEGYQYDHTKNDKVHTRNNFGTEREVDKTLGIESLDLFDSFIVMDDDSSDGGIFNSSPDSDIDVDNFNADSITELTKDNVKSLFDSLANVGTTQTSASHKNVLSGIVEDIMAKVIEPIDFHLREIGNRTSGAFASDLGIFVSAADKNDPNQVKPDFVTRMSAQEAYVHELVHKVIRKVLDTNTALRNRAVRLREEVRDSGLFTFEMFMPPNMDDLHPNYRAEKALATKKLHYILYNNKSHTVKYTNYEGKEVTDQMEDGLHEFMTHATTNEAFMNKMKELKVQNKQELEEDSTVFEKAVELYHKIINFFNTTVRKKHKTADLVAYQLLEDLSGVHLINEKRVGEAGFALLNSIGNGYSKVFDETVGKLAKAAVKKALPTGLPEEYFDPSSYWSSLNEVMKDTVSLMGAGHSNLLYQAFVEINPRSELNSFIHTGTRNKNKLLDKAIQKISSNVTKFFSKLLGPVTREQKAAITRVVLRLDLQSLMDTHSISDIGKLLTSPDKLLSTIRQLEQKIDKDYGKNANFYKLMSENLGYMLRTGDQQDYATANNAWLIANLKDTNLTAYGDLVQAEKDIDALASLHGLNGMGDVDIALVRDLIANQPEAMNSLMSIVQVNNKQRLKMAFDDNPAQMSKGYLKENYSHHLSYRIGTEEDKDIMNRDGFYKAMDLSNTLKDTSSRKMVYINRFQDLSTRTSGAISLADNHSRGTAVPTEHVQEIKKHYKQALKRAAAGQRTPVKGGNNAATPIVDTKGNVTNFRYTINHQVKEAFLDVDMDYDQAIARLEGTTITKPRTNRLNRELFRAAFDEYAKSDIDSVVDKFVVISPKAEGKLGEYWHMLPDEAQKDAVKIFGGERIILPKDGVLMAMGAPNWSSQSIKKRDINQADPGFKQTMDHVNNVAAVLLNNRAINLTDSLLREGVNFVKDAIVVKSGVVLLGNETSNILSLMVEGLSAARAIGDSAEGIKYAKDYTITADKLMQIRIKLRTSKNLTKEQITNLNRNALELRSRLRANPASEIIEAGMHQTLVEDVGDLDDNPNSMGRVEKMLKNNNIIRMISKGTDNKYGNAIKVVGSNLVMTHDSGVYRFLRDATQLSDFSARYALHKFNVEKGMDKAASINYIEDTFVHYDLPQHPFLQLGNDLGFFMFSKFAFRIQPIIVRQALEHPKNFLLLLLSQGLVGDYEDISDAFLSIRHLLNKFANPIDLLLSIFGIPLTSRLLLESS